MKKYIVLFAVVLIAGGGAGGWWLVARRSPAAQAQAYLARGDLAGATVALRAAVRANPDNADARMQLADLQLRAGDGVAAEREARAARQLKPADARPSLLLAEAYLAQGKFKDVLADFPVTSVPAEAQPSLLVLRASADLGLDDPAAADREATQAAAAAPNSADPPLVMARAAIARGDWTRAGTQVDRALTLDPKRIEAMLLKARLLERAGDRAGAVAQLDQVIKLSPGNGGALGQRALLLITLNEDARARADVDAALRIGGRDLIPPYLDAVLLTRAGKYAEADASYQKVSPAIARLPRGYYFLAVNKLGQGQLEQALDAAQRYNARDPSDISGIKLLAQCLIVARQAPRAVTLLTDAIKNGANDADIQDMLGRAYIATGQTGQAEQRFAAASALAPANVAVLARLAATRMALGDAGGASAALERSLEVAPDQAGTGENLAAAQIAAGDTKGAAESLAKLRKQTGETETTGNLQGMLEVAQGDPEAALARFAATAAAFPASTAARIDQARLLFSLGRPTEAEPVLASVVAQEPANMQALGMLVARYVQTGRSGQAGTLVQAALATQPGNPVLTSALSDLLLNAGKPKDALALTDAAAKSTAPIPVPILAARARALGADGQTAQARAAYTQILRANPRDFEARRQLIELLVAANDNDGAKATVRDGLRLAPGNQPLLETLLRIEFRAGGLAAATRLADELRADPANMPGAGTLKGDALMLAGKPTEALAAYSAAYNQTPGGLLALRVATSLAGQGRPDDGATLLRGWLKTHADDVEATRLLAQLDLGANRLPAATRGFETVLASQSRDLVALNNLAWLYQQQNDPRARPTALAAYTLQPNADTADTLGWIDVTGGDPAAGLRLIRQSDALRPNTPTVRYHMAVALDASGQKADAAAVLTPLVGSPATFAERADARKLLDRLTAK